MKNNNPKIIKVNHAHIMNPLNEEWAATAGFSSNLDYNCSGFSYEIKPLAFNLCQKGNDPEPEDNNKSFKHFVGDYVTGYCPYDGKKHSGMIKYLYWTPGSDETVPKLVYVLDFETEFTIPLEGSSIKQTLDRYNPNDLSQKDYFRARDTELEHSYAASEMPNIIESFDFNSNGKTLNEMKVASEETDKIAKKIWDDNNLGDRIIWEPEMWNNNEFDPVCGSVEFEGWRFTTNENSDYVHYLSPNNEEGDILRDI